MSMLWIICGAGRNVGKTTLALNLSQILPNSCYVKCGHGVRKSQKPEHFFDNIADLEEFIKTNQTSFEYLLIESNALARMGRGDLIFFIDGIEGETDFRDDVDQLRQKAHICLNEKSKETDWKKQLKKKISIKSLCHQICDVLLLQKKYLFGSEPTVRSKIWFESSGEHIFGMGLARLLEKVDQLGSLQSAAKSLDMSYRYAWDLIRTAEKHLGRSLIDRHAGGADGGGSTLSDHGKQMLEAFKKVNSDVSAYADERFQEFYHGINVNAEY